ncbi:DUF2752 domain-containing protein [Leptolyngbya sp. NIES-2104]|uniref:DUF2752 domain-containing protein n=1 Tax=Leptolyngbya sp. NIES-2104 TaxID=1552121 RepID=UPI0006ECB1C6|nr:DUF2752 domain-containing protein [Leptolyngbya sp. NIES-2104]GAP95446.1 hypothetical protein NIES2104_19680 [Leptolyngbya sp. NIES-2104]
MLASLLRSRKLCLILVAAAIVHFGLMLLGLPSWQCPIRHSLRVPCPGCGISRATIELLQGHFDHAFKIHAFAPIVVFVGGLVLSAIVLPKSSRIQLVRTINQIEQRTGITIVLLFSFFVYWLIRLFFFRSDLYQWVM